MDIGKAIFDASVSQARSAEAVLDDQDKLVALQNKKGPLSQADVDKKAELQLKLQEDFNKCYEAGGAELLGKPGEIKARLDAAGYLEPPFKAGEMVFPG